MMDILTFNGRKDNSEDGQSEMWMKVRVNNSLVKSVSGRLSYQEVMSIASDLHIIP